MIKADQDRLRQLIAAAIAAEQLGNLDLALDSYQEALLLAPQHQGLLLAMTRLQLSHGSREQAKLLVDQLLGLVPEAIDWHIAAAEWFCCNGQSQKAIAAYERAHGIDAAHLGVVEALDRLRQNEIRSSAAGPTVQELTSRAELAWGQGEVERAMEQFQQALDLVPDSQDHQAAVARCYRRLGNLNQAEKVLRQIISENPRHFHALVGMAELEASRSQFEAAADWYGRAYGQKSEMVLLLVEQIRCLNAAGRHKEVDQFLPSAINANPDNLFLLKLKFHRLIARENLEEALSAGEMLLCHSEQLGASGSGRAASGDPWDRIALARLLFQANRNDRALTTLQPLLADTLPNSVRAHALNLQGQHWRKLGDRMAALRCFQSAMDLEPAHGGNTLALVDLLVEFGDFEMALRLLAACEQQMDSLPALAEHRSRLLFARLRALKASGDDDSALSLAQNLLSDRQVGFSARVQRAELLAGRGDPLAGAAMAELTPQTNAQKRQSLLSDALRLQLTYDFAASFATVEPLLLAEPLDIYAADHACLMLVLLLRISEAWDLYRRLQRAKIASERPELVAAAREGLHICLLEEFDTHPHVRSLLGPLLCQPVAQQWRSLVEFLNREPGVLAALLPFMVAARRLGAFNLPPHSAGDLRPGPIPLRLVQFWQASPPPEGVRPLIQSWAQTNPSLDHQLFDENRALRFLEQQSSSMAIEAFNACLGPEMRLNLWCLAYLADRGGIFAAANLRARDSIDHLFANNVELVLVQDDMGGIASHFIAAVAGHPLIQRALQLACKQILERQGDNSWFLSGSAVLTRCLFEEFGSAIQVKLNQLEGNIDPAGDIDNPLGRVTILRQTMLQRWVSQQLRYPISVNVDGWDRQMPAPPRRIWPPGRRRQRPGKW
jgi:tetratricopeptide (TPR) repeat protein